MGGKGVGQEPFDLDVWGKSWKFGFGGYSGTSDLDLGKKVGNLDFWDGGVVFWNFGFGLRKKSWEFGFLGWGAVFWNFRFGLRKKSWEFGWGAILELRIWT